MSLECGNLWNARSPRGGDPNSAPIRLAFTFYPQVELAVLKLRHIQWLSCAFSLGPFLLNGNSALSLLCAVQEQPTFMAGQGGTEGGGI